MSSTIKISVVTPCLNRVKFIKEAIESVIQQDYSNYEHIIMDGGSTDGTLELLAQYPHLITVSQPDKNLYEALNRGIRLASGDVIVWLNSDDIITPNTFKEVSAFFEKDPSLDVVSGGSYKFKDKGSERLILHRHNALKNKEFKFSNIMREAFQINAKYFSRKFYDRFGLYDEDFPIVADYDFMLRACLVECNVKVSKNIFYAYRYHQDSLTFNQTWSKSKARWEAVEAVILKNISRCKDKDLDSFKDCYIHLKLMEGYCYLKRCQLRGIGTAMRDLFNLTELSKLFLFKRSLVHIANYLSGKAFRVF